MFFESVPPDDAMGIGQYMAECYRLKQAVNPGASAVRWEHGSPILLNEDLDWTSLEVSEGISEGAQGQIIKFVTKDGSFVAGKILHHHSNAHQHEDMLHHELSMYRALYARELPPYFCNVYGIAEIKIGNLAARALLMDGIDGVDGRELFDDLRDLWEQHRITSEEYFGAVQYIGRCLLKAIGYLEAAGIVHCDFKPKNLMVNESGEVFVLDLGIAQTAEDKITATTGDEDISPGEEILSTATDVFMAAATLVEGMQGRYFERPATQDLGQNEVWVRGKPREGVKSGRYGIYTPDPDNPGFGTTTYQPLNKITSQYSASLNKLMEKIPEKRPTPEQALSESFLAYGMLEDEAAMSLLGDVVKYGKALKAKSGLAFSRTGKSVSSTEISETPEAKQARDNARLSADWQAAFTAIRDQASTGAGDDQAEPVFRT